MKYGDKRYWELQRSADVRLTKEELAQGWHFCPDFDQDLLDCQGKEGEDGDEQGRCNWCGFDKRKIV